VFWSDLASRCTRPRSISRGATLNSPTRGPDGLLFALGGPIYAGTNEIQAQHHRRAAFWDCPAESGAGEVNSR